jgi:hypothetical protein
MSFPTLHSILNRLSTRLRCRPCRRRAALLLAVVALTVAFAVSGCREQGLTDPLPDAAVADDPGTSLAPEPAANPEVAAGAVATPATASTTRLPRSFFVNPGLGKDTNPGTKAFPFKTLAKALSLALAQDHRARAVVRERSGARGKRPAHHGRRAHQRRGIELRPQRQRRGRAELEPRHAPERGQDPKHRRPGVVPGRPVQGDVEGPHHDRS